MRNDRVPVGPLQRAFLDSGVTAAEVVARLGWTRRDTSRLRRHLGLMRHSAASHGTNEFAETIDYDKAVLICRALNLDPWEVDL